MSVAALDHCREAIAEFTQAIHEALLKGRVEDAQQAATGLRDAAAAYRDVREADAEEVRDDD